MSENSPTASRGGIEQAVQSAEDAEPMLLPSADILVGPKRRRRLALVTFGSLLALWVVLFLASGSLSSGPNPKHLGGDFVLFLSGAKVIEAGGNPYDQRVLYQSERRLLQADGIRPPAFDPYMRVGNPPLLFWLLQPLGKLPFGPLTIAWCAAMYALCAVGLLGFLWFLRWRRRLVPLLCFMAMPQTLYAAYYGNVDGLVVASLGVAAAIGRKYPFAAGALLTVAVLKPQVALPGAGLIMFFLLHSRLRAAAGFVVAGFFELLLTLVTTGPASVGWWVQALTGYSARLGVQPDIASLSGLYVYAASDSIRIALELTSFLVAVVATLAWWWPRRTSHGLTALAVSWPWILWFLVTPFAHFHDEVVLTLAILALLGRDGEWIGRWPATLTLYVLLLSVLIFPTSRAHTDFQSLTLLAILVCAVVQYVRFARASREQSVVLADASHGSFALPVPVREYEPGERSVRRAEGPFRPRKPSALTRLRLPSGFGVVAPILTLEVLLWVFVFGAARLFHEGPNGKAMGTDFAVFSGAASALKHGQNPYDYRVLYRSERELLTRQHLPVTTNELNVRAGNPPLFYWALEPLTTFPFQRVAMAWIVSMYLTSLGAFFLALRYFRWTSWLTPALIFALMPQVVTGAIYGNVHGPVFAALALCLVFLDRHPMLAGLIASFGWVKPQLALPLVLLIFLFQARSRRAFAAGFSLATFMLLGLTAITTGLNSLGLWVQGLNSWSHGIAREPNIASLSGLYAAWAPRALQLFFAAALMVAALALTAVAWKRLSGSRSLPLICTAWLWAVWFLVSPFTHFPDEIVLTIPLLALLGRNASRLSTRLASFALYLALFSLILFSSPLVSLSVGVFALILYRARSLSGDEPRATVRATGVA